MNMVTVLSLVVGGLLAGGEYRPEWLSDYGVALRQTQAEGKPLLIVLDDPADAARHVEQISYTEDRAQTELLRHYKLCRVDVSTEYGQKVAEAFGARQFPYTAIIDTEGEVQIFRKAGRFVDDEWTATLARYRNGQRRTISTAEVPQRQPVICFS